MLPQSVCILYRRTINKVNGDYNELNIEVSARAFDFMINHLLEQIGTSKKIVLSNNFYDFI